jgi:hypothetical protein
LNKARIEQAGRYPLRENLAAQVRLYQEAVRPSEKRDGSTTIWRGRSKRQTKLTSFTRKTGRIRISDELDKQKISNVSILEAPTVPSVPSKTNRPLTVLLGVRNGIAARFRLRSRRRIFPRNRSHARELEALTGLSGHGDFAAQSKASAAS